MNNNVKKYILYDAGYAIVSSCAVGVPEEASGNMQQYKGQGCWTSTDKPSRLTWKIKEPACVSVKVRMAEKSRRASVLRLEWPKRAGVRQCEVRIVTFLG